MRPARRGASATAVSASLLVAIAAMRPPLSPSVGGGWRRCLGLPCSRGASERAAVAARGGAWHSGDEFLGQLMGTRVRHLTRRGLHEVRGRTLERAAQAAVEPELAATHRVDHDAGAVRRIVRLALE